MSEITKQEKTSPSSGEIPDMHELLMTATPAERAKAEIERLMNSYPTDETPLANKKENDQAEKIYSDDMGRQHSIDDIRAQGSFYTKPASRVVAAAIIGIMAPYVALIVLAIVFLYPAISWLGLNIGLIIAVEAVISCGVGFFVFYQCATKIHGPLHNYKADGRGFYVTIKGKGSEQILFKDVLSVDYTPTKLLWGKRGYKVSIVLTYGIVRYDYIFPKFNQRVHLENLPFDVLKSNIPGQKQDAKNKR